MTEPVPFAVRRSELLDRAVAILSTDARFPAGWLEGSLADGIGDSYSHIDLHLCVADKAWEGAWPARRAVIEQIAAILASLDIPHIFEIACLLEGPLKLDVIFEKQSSIAARPRITVKPVPTENSESSEKSGVLRIAALMSPACLSATIR